MVLPLSGVRNFCQTRNRDSGGLDKSEVQRLQRRNTGSEETELNELYWCYCCRCCRPTPLHWKYNLTYYTTIVVEFALRRF